uniref:Uncharacterized protein n=1 Tax=Lactuca sativa TaxID=4236 RepID=A0A9R1WHB4_LACSA|nr:hypothetical protein LSAT_V11C100003280 [Lactuca sativa]
MYEPFFVLAANVLRASPFFPFQLSLFLSSSPLSASLSLSLISVDIIPKVGISGEEGKGIYESFYVLAAIVLRVDWIFVNIAIEI